MKKMRVFTMLLMGLPVIWVVYYLLTNPQIIPSFLNGSTMLVLPLVLGGILAKKYKGSWRIFGIGSLTFIGSQALHIPFNSFVLNPLLEKFNISAASTGSSLVILALLLGVSAGLFEELARFIVYKKWASDIKGWKQGLMFGAGHGGIEAMVLGAIVFYVFLQAVILKDMSADNIAALVGPGKLDQTVQFMNQYWQTPWYLAIMGAVERAIAVAFHISATLLVLQSIISGKKYWLWLAIGWHTLLDAVSVYASLTWGILTTEGILAILGGISIWIILRMVSILPAEETLEVEDPLPDPITADDLSSVDLNFK